MLWKSFGVTIKSQTKVAVRRAHATLRLSDKGDISSLTPLLPTNIEGQKYGCDDSDGDSSNNIYVGMVSGKCHTMLPRFTTAAHLLFDEFMATPVSYLPSSVSFFLVPGLAACF
ncbi:hypothetical protein ACLKA6_001713 [Drosophila palustris]